ncbi:amidohydrolase [Halalkalibacillus sediminis]|uniref:Amidohydrolase n=1 Tax=Halalkalibacillus sediminis TaxID=2018042 RepID=A0A2I0QV90_9BACI|nr:M20 family metallopeptidase [Halalkalibacillus sediminis]PKR78209.1 amidohydrolase [Halalkalibacillus sediminis]
MEIKNIVSEIEEEMIRVRRHLHRNPELSMKEYNTTQFVLDYLKDTSVELSVINDDIGVVGVLRGKKEGKTIGLRGDMDALPILEQTGLDFSSEVEGSMHACGHDLHTTVLLGTAIVLDRLKDELEGQVKFIFQPGEEVMKGAKFVIENGVLSNEPKVDKIVCLHTWPLVDAGKIGVRHGPIMAATDTFEIEVSGSGGHAAHPHIATDPIPVASQLVSSLQNIVSRQISPLNSAVLTLGQIHGGNADNIIANKVTLSGSIRTLDYETRDKMQESIELMADHVAKANHTDAKVTFHPGSPPVINDDELVDIMIESTTAELGEEGLAYLPDPSLGGEDFSFYLQETEGMLFRIGTRNDQEQSTRSLHNPGIIFDEKAIPAGITAMSAFAINYLKKDK